MNQIHLNILRVWYLFLIEKKKKENNNNNNLTDLNKILFFIYFDDSLANEISPITGQITLSTKQKWIKQSWNIWKMIIIRWSLLINNVRRPNFFISSTFWNQKSFVYDQFDSIRHFTRLVPTLTWIDINGSNGVFLDLKILVFSPRPLGERSVGMNTWPWKIGIGPEVKRGMEVVGRYEVTWGCAAHKGSFAPVNPSGFIEPHRAWHGIPATLLYAMYQNTVDPNYRGLFLEF